MKRSAMIVIVLAVLGGIVLYKPSTTHYQAPEAEVVKETVEVDALEQSIKTAQDSKKAEIEATAKAAYDEAYDQEMKKVELEVVKSFNEKLNARQTELEKETKTYWTRERVVSLIKQTFPDDAERALAIAKCESGLNPYVVSKPNKNGTHDGGLYQINEVHDRRMEAMGLDKLDPEDNATFARMLYEEEGWRPWTCRKHI